MNVVMKIFLSIFHCLEYFFIGIYLLGKYSVEGIINKSILWKIGITGTYAGLITLAVFKTGVFLKIIIFIGIILLLLAIGLTIDDFRHPKKENVNKTINPYFEGMTESEAKKEYRRLMKLVHPDNASGNLEKTQEISIAYSEYCKIRGYRD